MSERYGPETRGIIDAINGLKKPTHEFTTYRVLQFDLTAARVNELVELEGWFDFLGVGKLTGSASIRINEVTKDLIDLAYVETMTVPIRRFWLTNVAQAGAELTLGLGGNASFMAKPIRAGRQIFNYEAIDEDGALNIFETSQTRIVLPTFLFATFLNPVDLKEGMLTKVMCRLNPTNAVTYRLRLWDMAINGAVLPYAKELTLIYEMDFDAADDTPYTIMLNRPFWLQNAGQIFYTIEWSAAPGNTMGSIALEGEVYR